MRNKNRKSMLVILLLVFTMVGLVVACGGPKETASTSKGETGGSSGEKASQPPTNQDNKSSDSSSKDSGTAKKFPTKELKFIVPVSPGGGMDATARLLVKYWQEHLGGKFVVENIAGAEYNNAINAMLKSKPDGHQVLFMPGVIINQLLSDVNYDLKQFAWIGRVSSTYQVTVASNKSGIKSLKDLQKQEKLITAVTGLSSSQTVGQLLAAKELGLKVSPVTHKGSSEAILSVIRGDSQWTTSAELTMIPYIEKGDVVPLFVAGTEKRLPQLQQTPTLIELGYPQIDKVMAFHRIIATNPGTPPEIVKSLRDSFKKAVEDPRFVEDMKRMNDMPDYLSGEKTAELVKDSLDLIQPNIDYLKSFKQ